MLDLLLYILLMLIALGAVALNVMCLPGNWIMLLAAAGWSAYQGWHRPSLLVLGLMLIALLIGEAVELAGSMIGAKRFGASRTASIFSIVGAFIGAIIGSFFVPVPIVGSILGAIGGAFFFAWIVELIKQRPLEHATRAAVGAALGRGMGMFAKTCCGLAVWVALGFFAFP